MSQALPNQVSFWDGFPPRSSLFQFFRHQIVPITVGFVLLVAALAKGHELATAPVADKDIWTSRWFLIGVVELELFLGLWLVSGLYARAARYVALTCFTAFLVVS